MNDPAEATEHMEAPHEFIKRYFRERTEQLKQEISLRAAYRAKYFTEDCLWDSRRESISRSESEEIVELTSSENEATIITQSAAPHQRLRYHLIRAGTRWSIDRVDIKLPIGDEWSTLEEMTKRLGVVVKGPAPGK